MCVFFFLFIRFQTNKKLGSSLIEIKAVKDVKTNAAHLEEHLTTQTQTFRGFRNTNTLLDNRILRNLGLIHGAISQLLTLALSNGRSTNRFKLKSLTFTDSLCYFH